MSEARILRGGFKFRVDRPPQATAPALGPLGVYTIFPDAIMHIAFSGEVVVPPGDWEIGLVQNVWNDRVAIVYSEGGEVFFSHDREPLLDVLRTERDIWLDSLGQGVRRLVNNTAGDKQFSFSVEAGDTPSSPEIPGLRERCDGQIREQLVFAERVAQFGAAIAARQGGKVRVLAATAGTTYGFAWRLVPSSGGVDFKFKAFYPTRVETAPPFTLFLPHGVATGGVTANVYGDSLAARAREAYRRDCGHRPPRKGDEDLWK